jgi:hypothetical protein
VIVSDNNPERYDETEKLISSYYVNKENLLYFKNIENLGMAGNWNRLILECKTKYMIMLHDDDCVLPFFLSYVNSVVNKYADVSVLNSGKYKWNGGNIKIAPIKTKYKVIKHSKYTNFAYFSFGAPSGCLFRVDDIKEVGGFDADTYPSIDYVLVQKLCMNKKLVLQSCNKIVLYRIIANTTSKLETQLAWLDMDYNIKEELALTLNIPASIKNVVEYFEIKLRLRSISKIKKGIKYRGWTAGGDFFLFFFNIYRNLWKIFVWL